MFSAYCPDLLLGQCLTDVAPIFFIVLILITLKTCNGLKSPAQFYTKRFSTFEKVLINTNEDSKGIYSIVNTSNRASYHLIATKANLYSTAASAIIRAVAGCLASNHTSLRKAEMIALAAVLYVVAAATSSEVDVYKRQVLRSVAVLDIEVLPDDVEREHLLTLVLVDALDLDVDDGVGRCV